MAICPSVHRLVRSRAPCYDLSGQSAVPWSRRESLRAWQPGCFHRQINVMDADCCHKSHHMNLRNCSLHPQHLIGTFRLKRMESCVNRAENVWFMIKETGDVGIIKAKYRLGEIRSPLVSVLDWCEHVWVFSIVESVIRLRKMIYIYDKREITPRFT